MLQYEADKKWPLYIKYFIKNCIKDNIKHDQCISLANMWKNIETIKCSYGDYNDNLIKKYIPDIYKNRHVDISNSMSNLSINPYKTL